MYRLLVAIVLMLAAGAAAGATWPESYFNPKPADDDLVLPMPCGGAMAFRPIEVPGGRPLDDRRIVLGHSDEALAWSESLRSAYVAAPFPGSGPDQPVYYLGKYEVTAMQYAALDETNCPAVKMSGRLPAVRVSWADAVAFADRYTQWLFTHHRDALPRLAEETGFLRLPTEAEWEYAARGGKQVSEVDFSERIFPIPEGLDAYVWYQGTQSAAGRLHPVGLKAPNPLGLYDILGNAAEIVLEPYRANRLGRLHGQPGGFLSKGGDFQTPAPDIRSGARYEHNHFNAAQGGPTRPDSLGFRLSISAPVLGSAERVETVHQDWKRLRQRLGAADGPAGPDLLERLDGVVGEIDNPLLKHRLERIAAGLGADLAAREEQRDRSARTAIYNGAILGLKLGDDHRRAAGIRKLSEDAEALDREAAAKGLRSPFTPDQLARYRQGLANAERSVRVSLDAYGLTLLQSARDYTRETIMDQLGIVQAELEARDSQDLGRYADLFVLHVLNHQADGRADPDEWLGDVVPDETQDPGVTP